METYEVEFTRISRNDLCQIRKYIEEVSQDSFIAFSFCDRLLNKALSLKNMPERGAWIKARPGRRFIVHKPYLIIYRIIEKSKKVLVLRFWHGAKDRKNL